MQKNDYDLLKLQLGKILQNKPLTDEDVVISSSELEEIQRGLVYLSSCLRELNHFVTGICVGDLEGPQPSRHNYLAGSLKELHSVLRHLTWQTQQVASGDYRQRIEFLGDFSDAFNTMVEQLDERERKLKENTEVLASTNDLLKTIMDAHKDWIIVENQVDGEIVYNNRRRISDITQFSLEQMNYQEISVLEGNEAFGTEKSITYLCEDSGRYYSVTSYYILWNNQDAKVHYISDITQHKMEQKNLAEFAYLDPLTGTYNRRYCFLQLEKVMESQIPFALVMIDINGLKVVNDTYGHTMGDQYINSVVASLRKGIRETDVLCRLGGDEFVLILKNCPANITYNKMGAICKEIEGDRTNEYQMSISYGAVFVEEDNEYTAADLLVMSDEKMYEFKQAFKKRGGGQP